MKRDIIVSGIVAVALHVLILSGPLPTGGVPSSDISKTVSLSIIRPRPTVIPSFQEEAPPSTKPEPQVPPAPEPISKQTPIPKRKEVHKQPVAIEPRAKEREVSVTVMEDVTEQTLVKPQAEAPFPEKGLESIDNSGTDEGPHGERIEIKESATLETASIQKHDSHDALHEGGMAPGKGSAEGIITYAMPKYNPRPIYPEVARRRGYEGKVVLELEILETGKVGQIKIAKSSGFKVLDRAAVKSVKNWTFNPATEAGAKTKQWRTQPIIFDLKDF